MRYNDQNGHKWCKMCCLGHRWVSSYFFNTSQYIIVHIGCTLQNTWWGEKCKAVMMKTGPNDAKHIVWAIIRSFVLTIVFRFWIPFLQHNDATRRLGWAATSKMGPNDMLCVVWAISRFLFILTRVFRYYISLNISMRVRVSGDDENGPKWWQTCCLGHM